MSSNIDNSSNFSGYNQFIKERSSFQGDPNALQIKDSHIANKATDVAKEVKEDPMKQVPYYAACGTAGVGVSWLMDKFVRKICAGDTYENSSLQKTINRISNNKVLNKVDGIISWTASKPGGVYNRLKGNRVYKKLFGWIDNNEAREAFAKGRAKKLPPLVGFPIMESGAAMEMESKVKALLGNDMLNKFRGDQFPTVSGKIQKTLELTNNTPIDDFNFNNAEHVKLIRQQVAKILEKQSALKEGLVGKELKAFENAIKDLHSYQNKMAILEKLRGKGASPIAKTLSKLIIGTGHIMGGTLGMIILGGGLAVGLSIKNAFDAKKGERFSTLMEDILSGWVGGFLLLTPAAKIVNGISGFSSLEGKGLKKGLLRKIGWLTGVGQGTFNNFRKTAGWGLPKWKALGKVLVPGMLPGGLLRFALVAGVCMFGAAEVLKRVSHFLFGKPSPKPEEIEAERKAKEEEEKKKAEKQAEEASKKPAVNKETASNNNIKNFLDKAKTGQPIVPAKTTAPVADTAKVDEPKKQKDNYTYVPEVKPFAVPKDETETTRAVNGYERALAAANNTFKELNPDFDEKSLEIKQNKTV